MEENYDLHSHNPQWDQNDPLATVLAAKLKNIPGCAHRSQNYYIIKRDSDGGVRCGPLTEQETPRLPSAVLACFACLNKFGFNKYNWLLAFITVLYQRTFLFIHLSITGCYRPACNTPLLLFHLLFAMSSSFQLTLAFSIAFLVFGGREGCGVCVLF